MVSEHQLILVTGPARSGKSEWAETLAKRSGKSVLYVATAQIDTSDREWQQRIEQHQQRRPSTWQTLTVPIALAETIQTAPSNSCLLVDSLGTWLANLLEQDEATWSKTLHNLLESLQHATSDIIFVAEETGWGVVPAYPVGRLFRDRLGMLTRQIGAIAQPVYLVTGGHVLNLSTLGVPLEKASVERRNFEL
ncbi:bifunctional adenosylcobinamide kinase/adenosylcobinamide-phosphate guanylyltransferase [Stenomitos frigidus]|uniref:Adenosylcobinamide kinase n=1 Tax=Stenomitos frigidus ULC18 TaxID=2107698 RepID=A0A2T1E4U8_9CYAN|nr:bifunctional adenosylcobinamide kinase/adenosylcobinamide-phosphate guanylyltransferase [Stenomitos frigidus]PSB27782.1 bifunctional adenosylcobinamide kinase/adenosylcobinamide-phosphate guanylyltransferase [Stenomitos frigidus ULC18]